MGEAPAPPHRQGDNAKKLDQAVPAIAVEEGCPIEIIPFLRRSSRGLKKRAINALVRQSPYFLSLPVTA